MNLPVPCASEHRSHRLSTHLVRAAGEMTVILDPAERRVRAASTDPAVVDLVYRGIRSWGLAQVRLNRLTRTSPAPPISALLSIVWAALREKMRAPHVLVHEAVSAARHLGGARAAGFVNALLRRTLDDPVRSMEDEIDPQAKWNAPPWWIDKIHRQYPDEASDILAALACRAPLTVRVCAASSQAVPAYMEELRAAGLQGWQVGPLAVSVVPPMPVREIPGFRDGRVSVQDAASQRITEALDPAMFPSGRPAAILDACAAPGGKSIALAQMHVAVVWSVDVSSVRLERLRTDLPRVASTLRGQVQPVVGDVLDQSFWQEVAPVRGMPDVFDAIVLDAPCSASGVVRRHPEIAWRRNPADILRVVDIQRRMLDFLWRRLAVGGQFVFVTCSIFQEEGEQQARDFLSRTPDARPYPGPGRIMPVSNVLAGRDQDGFFFATFLKISVDDDAGAAVSHSDTGAVVPLSQGQ